MLVCLLGAPGRLLGIVLLVLQLVTAGGTYPVETEPAPLRWLSPLRPMTHMVRGLRATSWEARHGRHRPGAGPAGLPARGAGPDDVGRPPGPALDARPAVARAGAGGALTAGYGTRSEVLRVAVLVPWWRAGRGREARDHRPFEEATMKRPVVNITPAERAARVVGGALGPFVGRVGGVLLLLLALPFLDIGIAQNPMFAAAPPAWGSLLPGHAGMRLLLDATLTGDADQGRAVVLALGWLAAAAVAAVVVFRGVAIGSASGPRTPVGRYSARTVGSLVPSRRDVRQQPAGWASQDSAPSRGRHRANRTCPPRARSRAAVGRGPGRPGRLG